MKVSRLFRWIGLALCTVVVVLLGTFAWGWSRVQTSLPPLDGERVLPGLGAPATLSRDELGTAIIAAASVNDAMRTLGFAHGQDRFFQMDLVRRLASGRLAELLGDSALSVDRANVVHRFSVLAETVLANESAERRALIAAYVEGVNAGLQSLPSPPWEYTITRTEPRPWTAIDTVLASYAMTLDMQDSTGVYEHTLTTLRDTLGTAVVDYLNPLLAPEDSALDGSKAALPEPPPAATINLRKAALPATPDDTALLAERLVNGSNAMALPGDRTASGAGMVAGDPHLSLQLPNTWYRAQLTWRDAAGKAHTLTGVSLPGLPSIIIGTNGHIAWTFTNAAVDTGDLITVDLNPVAPELLYRQGTDFLEFDFRTDSIPLKNGDTEEVESTWTIHGPLVGKDELGKDLAYKWTFHDPSATNLALLDLATATTVDEALAVAAETGMTNQNLFVVDRAGAAAWTITGRLPDRFGYDGRFPVSWSYGDRGWRGWLPADQRPVMRAAPGGSLWSGNQRQIGGEAIARVGDSGYDDPQRAAQLEHGLAALREPAQPADLLAIQLDDRAAWASRWRELLERTLASAGPLNDRRAEFQQLLQAWDGHASADSVGYRLIRDWRAQLAELTLQPIFSRTLRADPQFAFWRLRYEAGLWALHRDQPLHLLSANYADWDALRLAAVDRVIARLDDAGVALAQATWGSMNELELHHTFGDALPGPLADWINLPRVPQAGDSRMPRVARPRYGASLRIVVSPGHEAEGLLHLPGGQSGNPLSPFYRAGHDDWVRGRPTPLLPGEVMHTLTLAP